MEPWGTSTLAGCSCEDFPIRTMWSRLLMRKDKIRPNIPTWKSIRREFVRKTSVLNLPERVGYMKCYRSIRLRLIIESLAVPSGTSARRFAVAREDLKPYLKSIKRSRFSGWSPSKVHKDFYNVFKDFTNHRTKTNRG